MAHSVTDLRRRKIFTLDTGDIGRFPSRQPMAKAAWTSSFSPSTVRTVLDEREVRA